MHYAAMVGHVPAMDWLVKQGASVMERNLKGGTPMYAAARRGIRLQAFIMWICGSHLYCGSQYRHISSFLPLYILDKYLQF